MIKATTSILSHRGRLSSVKTFHNCTGSNINVYRNYHKNERNFHSAAASSFLNNNSPSLSLHNHNHRDDDTRKSKGTRINSFIDLQTTTTRNYSPTAKAENASLALGLGAMAATAKAGQYAVSAYREWKENQPEEPEETIGSKNQDGDGDGDGDQQQQAKAKTNTNTKTSNNEKQNEKRENIFSSLFNVGTKYYEGGFEDKMTKGEAALILGVRPSSTAKRIKEAHRKLLILNHPDTGGSTFLSGKINEAKDLLIKAKAR